MLFHEVDKNGHKHCTISLDTLLVVQSTGTRSQIGGLNSTTKTSSGLRKRVCPCHVRPPFLTTKVQSQDTHQRFEEVVSLDQEESQCTTFQQTYLGEGQQNQSKPPGSISELQSGPTLRYKVISTADTALASSSFNSIPQVLFTFQSPYLFSIGLVSVFRLARDSPRLFKQHAQVVLLFEQYRINKGNQHPYRIATKFQYETITRLWCIFPDISIQLQKKITFCLRTLLTLQATATTRRADLSFIEERSKVCQVVQGQPLWPLQSPLLRPSMFLPFPPGNDMLKFPGCLYLVQWTVSVSIHIKQYFY